MASELPAYCGKRPAATVPDTLDLQAQMAPLAINGLTEPTDPDADYEIYWQAAFNTKPLARSVGRRAASGGRDDTPRLVISRKRMS